MPIICAVLLCPFKGNHAMLCNVNCGVDTDQLMLLTPHMM